MTEALIALRDITVSREDQKDALLRQLELRVREAPHRVANCLQIIASLLLMKARDAHSDETRVHLQEIHNRVISVAAVERQLCASELADEIDVAPYLTSLCENLFNSIVGNDRPITIGASASAYAIKPGDAVSLGLIATELVINAIKHGFPDGRMGHISVDFAGEANDWRLSVSDNGVGRSQNPNEPTPVGLGTKIVDALARQLKATVEIVPCSPGTMTVIHAGRKLS